MKKVLVITYYWPPSGGGGVQRWLKFVKYLPDFGWEPIVYTPENQNAPSKDNTLMRDISPELKIIRRPIWEPYNLYRMLSGRKKEENLGAAFASGKKSNKFFESLSNWIRSNFFIPDARKSWIKPSVSFLKEYIHKHDIDAVVTTGPPHSMHMIGLKLKKLTGVKWLADFRDPWTDIDYYDQLKLTKWANEKHHRLEREVLKNADIIVCVSNSNKEKLNLKAKVDIRVVTNGFDDVDVSFLSSPVEKKFSLAHIGTFMANRNPEILWDVLSDMILENKQFRQDFILRLVGKTDSVILNNLTNKGLAPFVHVEEPVSHNEAIQLQKSAQVLLLTVNKTGDSKGMVTGKVFEYLVSGRPILAIGPSDGDLAKILKETGTGVISDFNDKADLKKKLESYYMQFKRNTLTVNPKNTEKYSRKNLTREMADIINSLVK
jgi:glycosyltransferase involved in cell wall biosynthesis